MATTASRDRIRELNDIYRTTFAGGRVVMTSGVNALPPATKAKVLETVRTFSQFDASNDPHKEHDFGNFTVEGDKFFWKIDYYDPTLTGGSTDAADPAKTCRVLTIMRADEY